MTILIKNGKIYKEGKISAEDIYIKDGIINQIGIELDCKADTVIDAKNNYVLPGAIDVHTHFSLDTGKYTSVDDFYTGTVAAAYGGNTSIVDHISFFGRDVSLNYGIDQYEKLAEGKAVIDYSFHGVVENTSDNHLSEFDQLMDRGIVSIKIYTTYDGKLKDEEILRVLKKAKENGMVVTVHSENHDAIEELREEARAKGNNTPDYHAKTRPVQTEAEAINRLIYLSEIAGYPSLYFVHLSSELGLREIEEAKARGVENIYVETCPQYLVLDDSLYSKNGPVEGTKYIMAPPLRKKTDQDYLWEGIRNGLIDVVATDHCPFFFQSQKSLYSQDFFNSPGGAPGVEERMEIVLTEGEKRGISIERLLEVLIENPAKIFGLYPRKGILQEGADGDITIIEKKPYTIMYENRHSNVDYTTYEGFESNYKLSTLISRGEVVIENGRLLAEPGRGKFIKRNL